MVPQGCTPFCCQVIFDAVCLTYDRFSTAEGRPSSVADRTCGLRELSHYAALLMTSPCVRVG